MFPRPIIAAIAGLTFLASGNVALADRACFVLESQIMRLQAGGLDRREAERVRSLRQRLARAGGGYAAPTARAAKRSPSTRQRSLRGRTKPRSHALRQPAERGPQSEVERRFSGTYRTMCVRSCDGYYFPVSFSTTPDRFADDAEICTRMCPGTSVGLYVHSVPDDLPAEMTSLDGKPYSQLPNASRYRETFDQSCACGRPAIEEAVVPGDRQEAEERAPPVALPRPRSAPAEDPETIANSLGGFVATAIEPAAFASAQGRFGTPVRIVGPASVANQASELLLRPVSR
jgi:hypothetical protein